MADSSDPDLSAPPTTEDSLDALLGAAARSPAAPPPLARGDELLGRFRIERLIGVGGMGAVYLATDPTLERQVAVKLHHAGAGTARLHREAVAMARLAHPNVIAVFEVGEIAGKTFVVMEYVAGTTLRAWLGASRTTREIVDMLIGAGEGLAAAHDAGLVHRDFKPENVLVADGRPRVGDFGLARGSQSQDGEVVVAPTEATDRLATPLTRTGAVLGTPAYMAPEQLAGGSVDARADQFAFCVTAWELLHGERPFAGNNLTELARAIVAGPRKPARSARVRRVLERGLSVDPAARYPDMHALIAAMRRASRSRVPLALGGGAVLAAAAIAFALIPRDATPSCDDAGADLALPQGLPARVRAMGGPLADDGGTRIARSIAGFSASYRSVAQHACKALRIDHAWSDELYQRSRACLTIRTRTAAQLLESQLTSRADVADLIQIAVHLPRLDACLDAATLAASPPLPADPARLAAVVDARATLDAAADQLALSGGRATRDALARVAASPVATEPTVAARLALVRAEIAEAEDHVMPAEQLFRDAFYGARAIDDVELSLNAVGALIVSTGNIREDRAAADEWIRTGLSDAERAQTRAPQDAAIVFVVASRVRTLQDQVAEGAALAARAIALLEPTHSLALAEAVAALSEARCAAGQYAACRQLQDRALAIERELLGPRHPAVALMLGNLAMGLSEGDRADALAFATEAKSIIDESGDTSSIALAGTEVMLASMILNDNVEARYAEARAMLEDARRRKVAALGANHPDVAQIDADLSVCDSIDGKLEDGVKRLRSALAIQEAAIGPDSTRVADTLYNLAATLRDLKRYDEALAAARRSAVIDAAHRPDTTEHVVAQVMAAAIENLMGKHAAALVDATAALALPGARAQEFPRGWAAMEAGRALAPTDRTRSRAMLQEARSVFVAIKSDARVAEVDGLLR